MVEFGPYGTWLMPKRGVGENRAAKYFFGVFKPEIACAPNERIGNLLTLGCEAGLFVCRLHKDFSYCSGQNKRVQLYERKKAEAFDERTRR